MAGIHEPLLALILLASSGLHCYSPQPSCPDSCSCPQPSVLNCSFSSLSVMSPQHIQDYVTELDFSHNLLEGAALLRPHRHLQSVRLGNNTIVHLSLCIQRHRRVKDHGCVAWAPNLQLLSVERNLLRQLPQGLHALEALEVLKLSFNSISSIRPGELRNQRQLRELHLQHNLISSLPAYTIQHLEKLKVLDVSFNKMTSLHPSLYLSLRNIGADVSMVGNKWRCDCSMRSIRRWMAHHRSRDLHSGSLICASPPVLAGTDLLQLEDDDLNCWRPETEPQLHQDMMVDEGSEVLLSCATKDAFWWTPSGLAVNKPQSTLLISDVTVQDTGLYLCLSKEHEVVSVFYLQIRLNRKPRSISGSSQQMIPQVPARRAAEKRNQSVTNSDLTLAVCLSVFITFLVAFILGVLARPCIDVLWRRITRKKSSSASDSVSSARQYDNEAYSESEDKEEVRAHRERRVTFSRVDFREDNNVKYYDTVASSGQERKTNGAVMECETVMVEKHREDDSEGHSDRSGSEDMREPSGQKLEVVDISSGSELEKRRRGSSCSSGSSLSDNVSHKVQITHSSSQRQEDTVQQRAYSYKSKAAPQISIDGMNSMDEINGFDSEPHTNIGGPVAGPELWQDGEQFDFSHSVRSTSPRTSSRISSFNYSKQIVKSERLKREGSSGSSSYVSDNEPSHYTVNPDSEDEEEELGKSHREEKVSDGRLPPLRPKYSSSPQSSDTDEDSGDYPAHQSSSSSESDDEQTPKKPTIVVDVKSPSAKSFSSEVSEFDAMHYVKRQQATMKNDSETHWPTINVEQIPRTNRHLDIKITHSSSSSDSEDSTRLDPELWWPAINLECTIRVKRCLDIKVPGGDSQMENLREMSRPGLVGMLGIPPLSSSSDSVDRIKDIKVSYKGEATNARHPTKESWPVLDLEHTIPVQRHLDIKTPSLTSDSSSGSDTEDESIHITELPHKVGTSWLQFQEVPPETETHWPSIDLQKIPRIKRRLDITSMLRGSSDSKTQGPWPLLNLEDSFRIKRSLDFTVPSPTSNSSSSSDSEDEITNHITKQVPGATNITRYPIKRPPTSSYEPQGLWPTLDLEDSFRIKRCLEFKVLSPISDSFSNSDSENETLIRFTKQQQGATKEARNPVKVSPTSHEPQRRWPSLDLEDSFRIKRHLDFKVPSPNSDSLSSSDSEDETTNHITKQEQKVVTNAAMNPVKVSSAPSHEPQRLWLSVDLESSFKIKRHLDFKVPSPASDSLSSSDSEHEKTNHVIKQEQGVTNVTKYPIKESPTQSYELQGATDKYPVKISPTSSHGPLGPWPTLDLEDSFRIKRSLDVKSSSTTPDSLSSSDSEHETTNHVTKQEQKTVNLTRNPIKLSPTQSCQPQELWPKLELEDSFQIKRRLDIKTPSLASDSPSSSDSEHETTNHVIKQEQGVTNVTKHPIKESPTPSYEPQGLWPTLDLEDSYQIKRRLEFKRPSPSSNSFSSSDSENETTNGITKQEQRATNVVWHPIKGSPTPSHKPQRAWPSLDLENSFKIKRRLDFKVPYPASDSGATDKYPVKISPTSSHGPLGPWPTLDLEDSFRIKRSLDVKSSSTTPDSLSSSDSEHETTNHVVKQKQGVTNVTRHPIKGPATPSYKPQGLWPTLDLKNSYQIKRRLDFKMPSPTSDSLSSSDSENESTNCITQQEKRATNVVWHPIKGSPTPSHNPQRPGPSMDLEDSFQMKRRLDFKAPSPSSDSSSSSDREHETSNHVIKQEQGVTNVTKHPMKGPPTPSYKEQGLWPTLDLKNSYKIKRRLDFKRPSPTLTLLSRSNSEDETMNRITKREQRATNVARHSIKGSPTPSHKPQGPWPSLDLEDSFRTKRRLDVKSTSQTSDSSSSDCEHKANNHTTKQKHKTTSGTSYPIKGPTPSYEPQELWPTLELEDSFQIKRHLDIKALSPASDSSSSSDGEHETTNHVIKQKQGVTNVTSYPIKESPTPSYEPQGLWPTLDLEDSYRIKRHLDFKRPSPALDSLFSSDSEDETTNHITKQRATNVARHPIKGSPTPSHKPQGSWPSLDLEDSFRIKRRVDFKVPLSTSGSTSSSDSEHETTNRITKLEQKTTNVTRHPIKAPPTLNYEHHGLWPTVELEDSFRIKRRLHIKVPSPASDLSPSSNSEDEKKSVTVHTTSQDQGARWLALDLDLKRNPRIKRRLDIKASSPPPICTTSSDSKGEPPAHVETFAEVSAGTQGPSIDIGKGTRIKQRLDFIQAWPSVDRKDHTLGGNPPSSSDEQDDILELGSVTKTTPWLNLGINRRLEIRAPSLQSHLGPGSISSEALYSDYSTSDGEDENRDPKDTPKSHKKDANIKLKKYFVVTEDVGDKTTSMTPEINPELQSRWANMHLGFSRFRKRLEITSHASDSSGIKHKESPLTTESKHIMKGRDNTDNPGERERGFRNGNSIPASEGMSSASLKELSSSSSSENEAESIYYIRQKNKSQTPSSLYASHRAPTTLTTDDSEVSIFPHANISTTSQRQPKESDGTLEKRLPDQTPMKTPESTDHLLTQRTVEENDVMDGKARASGVNNSPIQYRRLIMKASSQPNNTSSTSEMTTQYSSSYSTRYQYPSLGPRMVPSPSFQDVLKKQFRPFRSNPEALQAETQSTSVGSRLSDLSIGSLRRIRDVSPSSTLAGSFTGQQQEVQITNVMPSSGSLSSLSTDAMGKNAPDKRERGLSALKAMSSERQTWDREEQSVDPIPPSDTPASFQHESELLHSSRSAGSRRVTDFPYDIPQYRTHTQQAQENPPPIPETPPPDEATELRWSSSQKQEKRGFYSSNISQV